MAAGLCRSHDKPPASTSPRRNNLMHAPQLTCAHVWPPCIVDDASSASFARFPAVVSVSFSISTARLKIAATSTSKDKPPTNASQRGNSLVYAPNAICDDLWLTWPAVQERAIADGTVLVFDVITSVGNLFLAFNTMIQVHNTVGLSRALVVFQSISPNLNPQEDKYVTYRSRSLTRSFGSRTSLRYLYT